MSPEPDRCETCRKLPDYCPGHPEDKPEADPRVAMVKAIRDAHTRDRAHTRKDQKP